MLLGIVCAMQALDIQRLQTQLQQLHQQLQQELQRRARF